MSLDKTVAPSSTMLKPVGKVLNSPREVIAEIVGEEEPSQKVIDAAARKKARFNAKRRAVRRKVV